MLALGLTKSKFNRQDAQLQVNRQDAVKTKHCIQKDFLQRNDMSGATWLHQVAKDTTTHRLPYLPAAEGQQCSHALLSPKGRNLCSLGW